MDDKVMDLEKKEVEHSKEEEEMETISSKKKQLGGLRTMPFILANDVCDRFAGVGFHANMITYLTQVLNLPLVKASNILTNFGGTSSFTPLVGALVADSFAGRFWTIIIGSLIYELGMMSLTVSAIMPQLRPPPCPTQQNCVEASHLQLWVLYLCLLLTSIGTGGLRPCVVTFAADQFDLSKSKSQSSWNFYNWYYFCMGVATLTALTVIVYIQDNVSWAWGLGLPTIVMALSVVAFILGSSLYRKVKPGGSPLIRLAQVVVASVKKRNVVLPADPALLYDNRDLDASISSNGKLLHTDQFRWLDRAAVVVDGDELNNSPNLWRLATVHRVEEVKCILRMLPVWAAGILLLASHSHLGSFTIQQARSMDRHITSHSSFEIPPATLSIFSVLTVLTGLPLYERVFIPFARRFTGNQAGITCLQRMGIGFGINIIATIASALVEKRRKAVAAHHGLIDHPTVIIPISVFWLVPQYCLHGAAEVFMAVGHLEFLIDQSPESMRSTAASLNSLTTSFGNYVGTLMVSLVHCYTGEDTNWLPDRNLNKGKLDYYYWLVTGVQVLNLMYYIICAWFYKYKPLEELTEGNKETEIELADGKRVSTIANGEKGGELSSKETC